MQRSVMIFGVAVLCLLLAGPLGAETGIAPGPVAASCSTASVMEPADDGLLAPSDDMRLGEDFTPPRIELDIIDTSLPPCPELRDCPLGNRCGDTRPCQLVGTPVKTNTGNKACVDGQNIRVCPIGQTIHTVTAACGQCPCCSTFPACFCPLDCGTAVLDWGCG